MLSHYTRAHSFGSRLVETTHQTKMEKFKPVQFSFRLIACLAMVSCQPVKKRTFPLEAHQPQVPVTRNEFVHQPAVFHSPAHTGSIAVKTDEECVEVKSDPPTMHVEHPTISSPAPPPWLPHFQVTPHHPSILTHEQALKHTTAEHIQHLIITSPTPPPAHVAPHHPSILSHEQGLKHTTVEHIQHLIITSPAPPPAHVAPHHPSIVTHEQQLKHTLVEHVQHPIITPSTPPPAHVAPHHPSILAHEQGLKPTFGEHIQHPIITAPAPHPANAVEAVERPIITPPAFPSPINFLPFFNQQSTQLLTPPITHQLALVAYDDCGELKIAPVAAPPKLPPVNVPTTPDNYIGGTVEILPASHNQPSHEVFAETGPMTAHAFELNTEPPTHIIHPPQQPPEYRIVAAPANVASRPMAFPYTHVTPVEPPKSVVLENVSITGLVPIPVPSAPNPSMPSECIDISNIFDWETLARRFGGGPQRTIPYVVVKK